MQQSSDPSSIGSGLEKTLAEFGVPQPPADADYALGRLAGLEFASALGIRPARRALARERQMLLRHAFRSRSATVATR